MRYDAVGEWYREWVTELGADPALTSVLTLDRGLSKARVLDLGCGAGRVARALADHGASVVGIDVSSELLDRARTVEASRERGISYFQTDAANRSWWDGTPFDGVVSNMAPSDIEDLDGTLRAVTTVLRADGWFVFSILHPCFPGTDRKLPSWPPARLLRPALVTTGGNGVEGRVGAYHRTLSSYLNSLVRAGLAIEGTDEPGYPSVTVPTWLTVSCRRAQPQGPPQ